MPQKCMAAAPCLHKALAGRDTQAGSSTTASSRPRTSVDVLQQLRCLPGGQSPLPSMPFGEVASNRLKKRVKSVAALGQVSLVHVNTLRIQQVLARREAVSLR